MKLTGQGGTPRIDSLVRPDGGLGMNSRCLQVKNPLAQLMF